MKYSEIAKKAVDLCDQQRAVLEEMLQAMRDIVNEMPVQSGCDSESRKVAMDKRMNQLEAEMDALSPFDFLSMEDGVNYLCGYLHDRFTNKGNELFNMLDDHGYGDVIKRAIPKKTGLTAGDLATVLQSPDLIVTAFKETLVEKDSLYELQRMFQAFGIDRYSLKLGELANAV
ncbi:hypothetical protein [Neptuniibacter sp. QD37_11]|uniref:hypothetical protein n=1 Tax=Neptuniibacter sp. QD37_11 TaxID=3398209 RepID=UPI0039F459EB